VSLAAIVMMSARADGGTGTVPGIVVDPGGLTVPGAQISVTCKDRSYGRISGPDGKFSVELSNRACTLAVSHPGFETFEETISPDATSVSVRLLLAPRKDTVDVVSGSAGSPLDRSTLTSISLSDTELKSISNNTADLIRYAQLMAGASGPNVIYVDGLPAGVLPPAEMIARIVVNADPFSPEYADGDQAHIDIITKSPDREFRFNVGSGSLGAGGKSILAPNQISRSSNTSWTLSGPVTGLPLSFSTQLSLGSTSTPLAVEAVPPPIPYPGYQWNTHSVSAENHNVSGGVTVYLCNGETTRCSVSYGESRFGSSNAGVGGLTLPEAGLHSRYRARNVRANISKTWGRVLYQSAFVLAATAANSSANSSGIGVTVAGDFTGGGGSITSSNSNHANWSWKNVFQSDSGGKLWTAGVTITRASDAIDQIPNAYGTLQFENMQQYVSALSGQEVGTWLVMRGNGLAYHANTAAAAFVQRQVIRWTNLVVNAGIRIDDQAGFGILASPRLSAATQWRGFFLRTGGGIFAHTLSNATLLRVIENSGDGLRELLANSASFLSVGSFQPGSEALVRAAFGPGLTMPRQFMERSSIEHPLGAVNLGVEYTWTRDEHLLGSRRVPSGSGWVDVLESGRDAQRQRIHPQVSYKFGAQRLFVFYDWIHSRDDTDGPFSFPSVQSNVRAEWARSTGVSPHNVSMAANFKLPEGITANLADSWRNSAPYNITTGLDPEDDGLYTGRGGRARNSGNGPGYNSMSLYAHKRVPLPRFPRLGHKRFYLNLGLQADNLLGNRNYISVGPVIGSSTFGRPLAAFPGRSVRLWLNLD